MPFNDVRRAENPIM